MRDVFSDILDVSMEVYKMQDLRPVKSGLFGEVEVEVFRF